MEEKIKEAFNRFRSNLMFTAPELIDMRVNELESEILSFVEDEKLDALAEWDTE